MAVQRVSGLGSLTCPLCGGGAGRGGCPSCHLSVADIRRHQRRSAGSHRRGLWTRFVGLVGYVGLVAWSWWFLPATLLFAIPGAVVGAYLHSVRGRPWLGGLWCFLIVVVAPLLVWGAGLTGLFAVHTGGH